MRPRPGAADTRSMHGDGQKVPEPGVPLQGAHPAPFSVLTWPRTGERASVTGQSLWVAPLALGWEAPCLASYPSLRLPPKGPSSPPAAAEDLRALGLERPRKRLSLHSIEGAPRGAVVTKRPLCTPNLTFVHRSSKTRDTCHL